MMGAEASAGSAGSAASAASAASADAAALKPPGKAPGGSKSPFICTKPVVVVEGGEVVVKACNKELTSRQALSNHSSSTRGFAGHGSRTCRFCLKALTSRAKQIDHESKCFPPRCVICKRIASSPAVLGVHMRQVHLPVIEKLHKLRVLYAAVPVRNGRPSTLVQPLVSCPDCGAMVQKRCLTKHLRKSCKFQNDDGSVRTEMCSCGMGFQMRRFYKHHKDTDCAEDRPPITSPQTIFFNHNANSK